MKKIPKVYSLGDRDRKGGLRTQPRKEVELQVLGNKNARGREQGETLFCQRSGGHQMEPLQGS